MSAPISKEAKRVIYNVHEFFKKRKTDPESFEHETDANLYKLVSEVTGVTAGSVKRILAEGRASIANTGETTFKAPGKHKQYTNKKIQIDEERKKEIKAKIDQFSTRYNRMPSIPELNKILKQDGTLKSQQTYLRKLLHKMGYKFEAGGKSKRRVLVAPKEHKEDGSARGGQLSQEISSSSLTARPKRGDKK